MINENDSVMICDNMVIVYCQLKRGTSLTQSVLMFFLMISQDREVSLPLSYLLTCLRTWYKFVGLVL